MPRNISKRVTQTLLNQEKSSEVADAIVSVIAQSNPTIDVLLANYKMSKSLYRLSLQAYYEYQKSGDIESAIKKVAESTIKHAIPYITSNVLSNAIDIGWGSIKKREGINTSKQEDQILTSVAKNTLSRVIKA